MPEAYFKLPDGSTVNADPRILNLPDMITLQAPYSDVIVNSLKDYFKSIRPIKSGMKVSSIVEALDDVATDAVDMRTFLVSAVAMTLKMPAQMIDKLMKYPIAILATTLMLSGDVEDKEVAFGTIAAIKRLDKFLEDLGYILDQLYKLPDDAELEVIS